MSLVIKCKNLFLAKTCSAVFSKGPYLIEDNSKRVIQEYEKLNL